MDQTKKNNQELSERTFISETQHEKPLITRNHMLKSQMNIATKPLHKGAHNRCRSQQLETHQHMESVLKGISFNYKKIRVPDCRPQNKCEPLHAQYQIARTPNLKDAEIKELIRRYPVSQQIGLQQQIQDHQLQIKSDKRQLFKVISKTTKSLVDTKSYLKEFTTSKVVNQVRQEDSEMTSALV